MTKEEKREMPAFRILRAVAVFLVIVMSGVMFACSNEFEPCTSGGTQAECCGSLACNATSMTCGAPLCGVPISGRPSAECILCLTGANNCTCFINSAQAGVRSDSSKAQADACGYFMPVASAPPLVSDVKSCMGYSTTAVLSQTTATQSRQFISCSTYDSSPNTCTLLDTYVGTDYGQDVTAPIIGQDGIVIGNYTVSDGSVSYAECDPRYQGTMNLTFDPALVQSVLSVYLTEISGDDAWDLVEQHSYNWDCGGDCNAAASTFPPPLITFSKTDNWHFSHYWSIRDRCRGQARLSGTFTISYIPLNTTYQTANLTYSTAGNCTLPPCIAAIGPCTSSPDNCCKVSSGLVLQDMFCDNLTTPSNPRCSYCKNTVGQLCNAQMPCCAPLYCDGATGTCMQTCNTSGLSCSSNNDCCNPLVCGLASPRVCTCRGAGMPCVDSSYCCGGYLCSAQTNQCETRQLPVCSSESFGDVTRLAGIAGIGMIALAAFVYMVGETFRNPRMLSWAKGELWEVVFSLFVVSMTLFSLSAFCGVQVGEAGRISSSLPSIYAGNEGANMYEGALMYFENLAGVGLRNMAQLRSNLGAHEIRTSFQIYDCKALCFITMISMMQAKYSGESVDLAVTNNLLGAATISYLSVLFQYFTLQYIVSGLFVILLPLAIVVRSIPFMRNFGGALIGIIIALYVMYPTAQLASAIMLPYMARGLGSVDIYNADDSNCAGIAVFSEPSGASAIKCRSPSYFERDMGDKGASEDTLPQVTSLNESIKTNVLMFLAGVFLPAFNFIIIASLARDISGLLGDEADIGRLGQMV